MNRTYLYTEFYEYFISLTKKWGKELSGNNQKNENLFFFLSSPRNKEQEDVIYSERKRNDPE